MMKSDKLTDVTFVCDDKEQFKMQKIILSVATLYQDRMNEVLKVAKSLEVTDNNSKDNCFELKVEVPTEDKTCKNEDKSQLQRRLKEFCSDAYSELKSESETNSGTESKETKEDPQPQKIVNSLFICKSQQD